MSHPVTTTELADALECFWNAALGAQQNELTQVGCMAEGIAAVAYRLREHDNAASDIGVSVRLSVHQAVSQHGFLTPEQRDRIVASVMEAIT